MQKFNNGWTREVERLRAENRALREARDMHRIGEYTQNRGTIRRVCRRGMSVCAVVVILGLIWLLAGCAPAATIARQDGFDAQWRGFAAIDGLPATAEAKITVEIIVTDDLPTGIAATYSHPQGVIRIRGKIVQGKIIVCEAALGHEIMHALQYQAECFVNPDKLTEMGD